MLDARELGTLQLGLNQTNKDGRAQWAAQCELLSTQKVINSNLSLAYNAATQSFPYSEFPSHLGEA